MLNEARGIAGPVHAVRFVYVGEALWVLQFFGNLDGVNLLALHCNETEVPRPTVAQLPNRGPESEHLIENQSMPRLPEWGRPAESGS